MFGEESRRARTRKLKPSRADTPRRAMQRQQRRLDTFTSDLLLHETPGSDECPRVCECKCRRALLRYAGAYS